MAPILLLEGQQLRDLATIIKNQEHLALGKIQFNSSIEMNKYMMDVSKNYDKVIKLIDDADAMKQQYKDDKTRSSAANEIYSYMEMAVNTSLQAVRNCTLRTSYLEKIGEHCNNILEALKTIDPNNVEDVESLAKEARQYKESMRNFMEDHESPASRNFSRWLKDQDITFEDLVARYKNKRGLSGPFEDLSDEEKLLVYDDIIKASGRGGFKTNVFSKFSKAAGVAFLIAAAGIMVWDIFTAEHVFETATRDAMNTVASVGGALVGQVVGAALPSLMGIEASSLFVLGTTIIGSFAGSFILGSFVGWLLDSIFGSGGSVPRNVNEHHCYVAPLPDGKKVAYEIAHDGPN